MSSRKTTTAPLAIITGSGGGLGQAFAKQLAALGYDLALLEANAEADAAIRKTLAQEFPNCQVVGVVGDVADATTWTALTDMLGDRPVSLLVNNAGTLHVGEITDSKPEDLRHVVEVNLIGVLYGCQAIVPRLAITAGSPLPTGVLNVASIFALISPPGFSAYNASKAGVVGLSETLLGELEPRGFNVTVILPGLIPTGLMKNARYTSQQQKKQVADYMLSVELTTDTVAQQALQAFKRKRFEVAIGRKATYLWRMKRWLPLPLMNLATKKLRSKLKLIPNEPS